MPTLPILLAAASLIFSGAAVPAAAEPIVPLRTSFTWWDHHWFLWLPRDPRYEAVEIHANDTGGPDGRPLVWAYFTQRAQPKAQVDFVNSPGLAAANHWNYRDIAYLITGKPGGPRGVEAHLLDDRNRAVSIEMDFAPDARLSPAGTGVTDQIGHGADHALLLLYRGASADTWASRVVVDGENMAEPVPGRGDPVNFHAAYSPGTVNAAFLFGDFLHGFGAENPATPRALAFAEGPAPDASHHLYEAHQDAADIELVTDPTGATQTYRVRKGGHVLNVGFEPALPPIGAPASAHSSYSVGVDQLNRLEGGTVDTLVSAGGAVLDWHPTMPDWTRAYPFRTTLVPTGNGQTRMVTQTQRQ